MPVLVVLPVAAVLFLAWGQAGWEKAMIALVVTILLVVAIAAGVAWWRWSLAKKRQKALQLSDIDQMNGIVFEHYVADLLRSQGYSEVTVTPDQNDFGADVIFADPETKITYAAQVKRYRGFVGVEALYQAAGGRDYYGRQRAAVITNSRFSTQALELAQKTGMMLIDRDVLADWIVAFQHHT